MAFSDLLSAAWRDHGNDPNDVWLRLPGLAGAASTPEDLAALAGLASHVAGEHLGRWDAGVAYLEGLTRHAGYDPAHAASGSVWRSVAALHQCAGNNEARAAALARIGGDPADSARVDAVAASALAAQGRLAGAAAAFHRAESAVIDLPDDHPAVRAVAITGNNLAASLEEATDRDGDATVLMKHAASTARRAWARAGNWMNVERAEYRLAKTHLAAGEPAEALAHADACDSLCDAHSADHFERFFAKEVVALARAACGDVERARVARAEAAALLAMVDKEGDRAYGEKWLEMLDAAIG